MKWLVTQKLSLEEIRDEVRIRLKGFCGVYRACDGQDMRLCEGHSYGNPIGMGGAGSGTSFYNNFRALEKLHFKTHLVGDILNRTRHSTFSGMNFPCPSWERVPLA